MRLNLNLVLLGYGLVGSALATSYCVCVPLRVSHFSCVNEAGTKYYKGYCSNK